MARGFAARVGPGSIITVSFPVTDLSAVKRRPALVLLARGEDLVVCGVTSKLSRGRDAVPLRQEDLEEGRLPKPSEVRPLKLFTIHRSPRPLGRGPGSGADAEGDRASAGLGLGDRQPRVPPLTGLSPPRSPRRNARIG